MLGKGPANGRNPIDVRSPLFAGQGNGRSHFKSESDSSRNTFLDGVIQSGANTRLYVARNMPDKIARHLLGHHAGQLKVVACLD